MISLQTEGKSLPSVFLANTAYDISVTIDGAIPLFTEWSLASDLTVIASGAGTPFRLSVTTPGSYTLHVKALGSTGHGEESLTTILVSSRRAEAPTLSVRWSRLQVAKGQPVTAKLVYSDPEGAAASFLSWSLYWNSNLVSTGTDPLVTIAAAQHGLYRLRAQATDSTGTTITADSSLRVGGDYEVLPAIVPAYGVTSFQYLGCLYSDTFTVAAMTASELPFNVATFLQEAVLLPGTTHIRFMLDDTTEVDDEIVIRTNMGNWAVIGPPNGLSTESLVYDYSLAKPFLPAPADHRLAYTLDVINAHGYAVAASTFRVKVECYDGANAIYEYNRCSYCTYTGGTGARQRRLIAVVENLEVDLDAVYQQHRGGADSTVVYNTQIPNRIQATASTTGLPYPQLPMTGFMYTEANLVALYDPAPGTALPVLEAKGVYGLSGLRPFAFTISIPKDQPIIQRIRRAYGTLAIYMANGGVNTGQSITARVKTNNGFVDYEVPLSDVYTEETDVFEKIGKVEIDVSDYGFDIGGLAIYMTIHE